MLYLALFNTTDSDHQLINRELHKSLLSECVW